MKNLQQDDRFYASLQANISRFIRRFMHSEFERKQTVILEFYFLQNKREIISTKTLT